MSDLEYQLKEAIKCAFEKAFDQSITLDDIVIEIPKDKSHGDYATNVAMKLARILKKSSRDIAEALIAQMDDPVIQRCELAGPGFINFTMNHSAMSTVIDSVLAEGDNYGHNDSGKGVKINVEYVSANPTGDLHLGHARGAAWGDSVTRLLSACNYDVCREYYVNDAGNQIHALTLSLMARYAQLFHIEKEMPKDGYLGKDVALIAERIAEQDKDRWLHEDEDTAYAYFRREGMKQELAKLQRDLDLFRVHFDVWSSEQQLHDDGQVEKVLHKLNELGQTYEQDDALWFASSKYGDDKDRVLRKSDGSYTYLVPDIAYHITKFERGFDKLVNFWGADHHGYIPRMKAAMQALGKNPDQLEVDIIQMVRLVENKEEIKMSKRTGNAVTVRELCEEVGVDAVRYFFVQRALDTHLDFDLALARKQSNDNPVYYAQYAHARICSILKQAEQFPACCNYDRLTDDKEIQLLKYINEFPAVVADAAKHRAPNKVCNYIQKLAAFFHSFYNACKVIDPSDEELSSQRLALLKATKITLKNALYLIGVEAADKM
ncbi:arginine--tRNA ligase [bacterium c-19]|nr:arginine--tRNA ligase [bacterium c-19]